MQLLLQAAFARAKKIFNPQSIGAVLCGQKQMAEVLQCFAIASFVVGMNGFIVY
jgi:hypothetical protein